MTVAEALAGYAAGLSYDDLDEEAVEAAKTRILDSLSCALAAFPEGTVERVRAYSMRKRGERAAAVIGTDRTAAPEYAALANGTAVRYLDWNDTGVVARGAGCGHPSDNLAAVLSAADAADRSGRDVLLATALAYEVHCQLCDAFDLYSSGLDHVNYEVAASALSAGRLLGLSESELAEAVSIGLAGHLGLLQARSGALSDWKGVAAANAARNGVVAAELAGEGITGPSPIFEGTYGLFNLLDGGEYAVDVDAFGGNGGQFKVGTTLLKRYPLGTHAQSAVECALALREAVGDIGDVERIEVETYGSAIDMMGGPEKWEPETRETADHSLPYIVARAFIDGEMGLDQFTPEKIRDPAVRDLMAELDVEENPEFTETGRLPCRMTAVTADGRHEHAVDSPKGHPERPFTDEDLRRKFRAAAGDRLGDDRIDEVVSWVDGLERKESLSELYSMLAV